MKRHRFKFLLAIIFFITTADLICLDGIDQYLYYCQVCNQFGKTGDWRKGEMELIQDKEAILAAQETYYHQFLDTRIFFGKCLSNEPYGSYT